MNMRKRVIQMIINSNGVYQFTDEESTRLHQIVEELKEIFQADSVGLYNKERSLYGKDDWCIDITGTYFNHRIDDIRRGIYHT